MKDSEVSESYKTTETRSLEKDIVADCPKR